MYKLKKIIIKLLKNSKKLSALSCRLTKLTGKAKYNIHPKHLVKFEKIWYLKDIKASDVILDLGCGNGQHSLRASKKCKKVIGVDYDKIQLNIARARARSQKIKNIKFLKADLEKKLKFKSNSFDKVLALDILEHLNNRQLFLKEIKKVLKPKGLAFFAVPNKNTSWKKLQKKAGLNYFADPDHKIEYSLGQIKKILKKFNFKIISADPVVFDTPFIGFIDIFGGLSLKVYKQINLQRLNKVKNNIFESTGFRIKAQNL